jgi:hypothetical protein
MPVEKISLGKINSERNPPKMTEEFKKSEQPFAHLVRALQEGEARRLSQCLEEIDHRLLSCRKSLEEYRRLRIALRIINSQLSRLGAEPLSVTDDLATHDLSEIIKSRIDHFKSTGKI